MLMQPMPMSQNISRPFVVGLVMLLLFISVQTDWGSGKQQPGGRRADLRQLGFPAAPQGPQLPSTKEKIIYELSLSNDKLERENWQMKQHILDLRRAMRKEGCDLNGTLYTFPDVEKWLQAANDTARAYFDKHRPKHHVNPHFELQVEQQHQQQGTGAQHLRANEHDSAAKGPLRFAMLR